MATAANLPPAAAEERTPPTRKAHATRRRDGRTQPGNREIRAKASIPLTILMWLIAAIYALPLLWFLLSSFKPGSELFSYPLSMVPREWTLDGYAAALERIDFARYFLNTAIVAT